MFDVSLSVELGTPITPGFDALVFKASRGIEDIYELTYIRKDGSRLPAVVSVTALRDAAEAIIGYRHMCSRSYRVPIFFCHKVLFRMLPRALHRGCWAQEIRPEISH